MYKQFLEEKPRVQKTGKVVLYVGILTLGILGSLYFHGPSPILPPLPIEEYDNTQARSFGLIDYSLKNESAVEISSLDQIRGPSHFILHMESNSTFEIVNISFIVVFSSNVSCPVLLMYDGAYLGIAAEQASPTCLKFMDDRPRITKSYQSYLYGFVLEAPVQILYIGMYFNNLRIQEFL